MMVFSLIMQFCSIFSGADRYLRNYRSTTSTLKLAYNWKTRTFVWGDEYTYVNNYSQEYNKYIFDNDDEAAAQIMLAANYGGRAINITATTAPHAFSYKITSLYKFPHGHAVAVGLPEIWDYMTNHMNHCIDSRGQDYLYNIFIDISKSMGCEKPAHAIEKFREIMVEMELKNPVSVNRTEDLNMLSKSVNPVRLKNNPIELDIPAIKSLYEKIVF